MQSTSYAYSIGSAIKSGNERRFRAAVRDIFAEDTSIRRQITDSLHQARSSNDIQTVNALTRVLEESEKLLLENHFESIAVDSTLLDAGDRLEERPMPFVTTIQRWLASELVPHGKILASSESNVLFEAAARWLFWFRFLAPLERRERFASTAAASGIDGSELMARRGVERLFEYVEPYLHDTLLALALPYAQIPIWVQAETTIEWRTKKLVANVVRSTAPSMGFDIIGVIGGCDVSVWIRLSEYGTRAPVFVDTGAGITTISRSFLARMQPKANTKPLPNAITFSGVVDGAYDVCTDYASLNIYLDATVGGCKRTICITHDVAVSDQHSVDMLLGMDIIKRHGICLDSVQRTMTVTHCQHAKVQLEYKTFERCQVSGGAKK